MTPEVEQIYNPLPFVSDEVSPSTKTLHSRRTVGKPEELQGSDHGLETVDARHPDWKLSVYGDGSQKNPFRIR